MSGECAREALLRLRRTALEAPSAEERLAALQEYRERVEMHTRPTEKQLQPVMWP